MAVIEVERLTRKYGTLVALNNITMSISEGEVFGLLGPNGAGKTTMVNILATQLTPTSGTASVCGFDCVAHARMVRSLVGVAPANTRSLYWRLTGEENLLHYADLYGLSASTAKARVRECLELLGLSEVGKRLVSTYSHGMRARLLLARALIHRPRVLLLDEPWSALDPEGRQELINTLTEIASDDRTVFVCSHDLALVERVCTRVAIINAGEIICEGKPSELISRLPFQYVAELRQVPRPTVEKIAASIPWKWEMIGNEVKIEVSDPKVVFAWAEDSGLLSQGSLSIRRSSLEDVYFFEMQKRAREGI
ncbi:MAG TPA: ABC transporter ATP-binding protein [Bacillota bacterium]|jgi:ABC-2 type transport system ATP-binding protein|nr:ABC transporter ATP-binding protein [Bacillota bacterium]